MSFTIAVAGKGGNGKTSIASLIVRYLLKKGKVPVLAVDADANANLGDSLGVQVKDTVGSMLATFQSEKMRIPAGMTKETYLDIKLNELLVENQGFDLLTMGRNEGEGCYCYPNTVLRKFIDNLEKNYKFTVMDNEAGMEHLSRGTTQNADELLLVSNATVKGVRTVGRIIELVTELKLRIGNKRVIINMVDGKPDDAVINEMHRLSIVPAALIPLDNDLARFDLDLRPLPELPDSSPSVKAIDNLMGNILGLNRSEITA